MKALVEYYINLPYHQEDAYLRAKYLDTDRCRL
jgi:hypothetical protein